MPTLLWHLALVATAGASLVISEVADKGAADACDGEEWVELHNNGDAAAPLTGLILHDDKGAADEDALALGGSLGAGEYLLLCRKADFEFKIGGSDTVSLSLDDTVVVDTTPACCADSDERSYGRVHSTSEFAVLATRTPGAANVGAAALPSPPKATDDARRASVAFVHALRIRSGAENDQVSRWAYSDACSAKRPSESAQIARTCTVRRDDVRRAPRTGEAGCTSMGNGAIAREALHDRRSGAAGSSKSTAVLRRKLGHDLASALSVK